MACASALYPRSQWVRAGLATKQLRQLAIKIGKPGPARLGGRARAGPSLRPGRQTDPTRQNVIREFVSHRLKPIRPRLGQCAQFFCSSLAASAAKLIAIPDVIERADADESCASQAKPPKTGIRFVAVFVDRTAGFFQHLVRLRYFTVFWWTLAPPRP
jgi:hypothetical protein